jgi:hypothetical protein
MRGSSLSLDCQRPILNSPTRRRQTRDLPLAASANRNQPANDRSTPRPAGLSPVEIRDAHLIQSACTAIVISARAHAYSPGGALTLAFLLYLRLQNKCCTAATTSCASARLPHRKAPGCKKLPGCYGTGVVRSVLDSLTQNHKSATVLPPITPTFNLTGPVVARKALREEAHRFAASRLAPAANPVLWLPCLRRRRMPLKSHSPPPRDRAV